MIEICFIVQLINFLKNLCSLSIVNSNNSVKYLISAFIRIDVVAVVFVFGIPSRRPFLQVADIYRKPSGIFSVFLEIHSPSSKFWGHLRDIFFCKILILWVCFFGDFPLIISIPCVDTLSGLEEFLCLIH